MTLSTGPWWWAPVFALGWITTLPAHSFSAPARAWVIAAARFMPGVCGVFTSSSLEWTTRTPSNFHLGAVKVESPSGRVGRSAHPGRSGRIIAGGLSVAQHGKPFKGDRYETRKSSVPHLRAGARGQRRLRRRRHAGQGQG